MGTAACEVAGTKLTRSCVQHLNWVGTCYWATCESWWPVSGVLIVKLCGLLSKPGGGKNEIANVQHRAGRRHGTNGDTGDASGRRAMAGYWLPGWLPGWLSTNDDRTVPIFTNHTNKRRVATDEGWHLLGPGGTAFRGRPTFLCHRGVSNGDFSLGD